MRGTIIPGAVRSPHSGEGAIWWNLQPASMQVPLSGRQAPRIHRLCSGCLIPRQLKCFAAATYMDNLSFPKSPFSVECTEGRRADTCVPSIRLLFDKSAAHPPMEVFFNSRVTTFTGYGRRWSPRSPRSCPTQRNIWKCMRIARLFFARHKQGRGSRRRRPSACMTSSFNARGRISLRHVPPPPRPRPVGLKAMPMTQTCVDNRSSFSIWS